MSRYLAINQVSSPEITPWLLPKRLKRSGFECRRMALAVAWQIGPWRLPNIAGPVAHSWDAAKIPICARAVSASFGDLAPGRGCEQVLTQTEIPCLIAFMSRAAGIPGLSEAVGSTVAVPNPHRVCRRSCRRCCGVHIARCCARGRWFVAKAARACAGVVSREFFLVERSKAR